LQCGRREKGEVIESIVDGEREREVALLRARRLL
jgi:hypothetical protein